MNLKHGDDILKFFELFYEDWMDDEDKQEFIVSCLDQMGLTLFDFDRNLSIGVENGYTIEHQLELCKNIIESIRENDNI